MPPRFAYWTIILDGAPTSFRTKERDEILPLFNQLKAKNPGALLKWFSGGRLWDSPEQAKELRGVEKVRRFRDDRAQQMKAERESGEDPLAEFRAKLCFQAVIVDPISCLYASVGHPNPTGARVYAAAILQALETNGIIPAHE